jgi:Na+/proline symporter/signal transduction histidine kinase
MTFNIDSAIFIGFLVFNLAVGLWYSSGIKTIKEYAVGDRNFSTGTIAATVIATCIGGGFFSGAIAESYRQGLYFIIPAMGEPLALVVIGYFLAPRMAEFLGALSVAEALGNIYGKYVRIISAIGSIFLCAGIVALQFKVSSTIFELFFGLSGFYAVLTSALIVILYSSLGGIKAVTFTDIIQFFTFGTVVPILTLVIWGTLGEPQKVFSTIMANPLFDLSQVLNVYNPKFINSLFLLLFYLVPCFQPVFFQRALMAKDTRQIRSAFSIAGLVCLILLLITVWVGVLILADNPTLEPNNLLGYIILNYGYPGLKGLTAVGVMSIIMSTADSYINSAAVTFTNDIIKPLNLRITIKTDDLVISRVFAVTLGAGAFLLAFKASTILKLLIFVLGFYTPVVSGPLLLAIFGFRSTPRSAIIGMLAGIAIVISFEIFEITMVDAVIPGLFINMICLLMSHYLLGEPGGWVGIKNPEPLIAIRLERKQLIQKFIRTAKEFDLWDFCRNNTPKQEYLYSLFGFFCIISVFSTMYSIPKNIQLEHKQILEFIYHTVLVASSILITFPIWPLTFKQEAFISIAWNIMLPYILVFAPTLLIIVSDFGQFQLMIFLLNIIIIAFMLRWQVAISMVCITVFLSVQFYKWYMGVSDLGPAISLGLQFKIMYVLLLVSSILIAFLKPKQEYVEATEQKADALEGEKAILDHKVVNLDTQVKTLEVQKARLTGDVTALGLQVGAAKDEKAKLIHEVTNLGAHVTGLEDEKARLTGRVKDLSAEVTDLASQVGDLNEQVTHYTEQIADKDKEIDRLGQTSQRILNNVNHELRLPIGNVVNFSEMLQGTLGRLENNKLVKELAKEVYDNSNRVSTMILNMLDLATLAVKKVDLEKTMVNFSELVLERVRRCQKIYLNGKNIEFKLDIEPEILISVDPNYMRQTVDNLVINSINFSKQRPITISVVKKDGSVIFTITDQGVGIPEGEQFSIFTPFIMGSNTESKTQGRGVGLALCKSAVEAYGGSIKAESDGECGAKLQFTLPI